MRLVENRNLAFDPRFIFYSVIIFSHANVLFIFSNLQLRKYKVSNKLAELKLLTLLPSYEALNKCKNIQISLYFSPRFIESQMETLIWKNF